MEDNSNNSQNEGNQFIEKDDEQIEDNINLNYNENSQNFIEDQIESNSINNVEFIQNSGNYKNIISGVNIQPIYNQEIQKLTRQQNLNYQNNQGLYDNTINRDNYQVYQQFGQFNQYNNRSENKIVNRGDFENDFNENEIQNLSQQFNPNNQFNNICQNQFMNRENFNPYFKENQNEMLNLSPLFHQQNQFNDVTQNKYINQENIASDFYINKQQNVRPQYNQINQYNRQVQNKFTNPENFVSNFNQNEEQNLTKPLNPNNQYINLQGNQFIKRGNSTTYYTHAPNEMTYLPPQLTQNNQFNNTTQNRFNNQEYLQPQSTEDVNNLVSLITRIVISILNQQKSNYSFNNNYQNNPYNFRNNNNFNPRFSNSNQGFNQKGQNYKIFIGQNKNITSYNTINNKKQNVVKQKNLNKIFNNNQIKGNNFNISKKNENENNSQNNTNLSKNKIFKTIKDLNINNLLDENRLKDIPDINEFIRNKAKNLNYNLSSEDNKLLNDNNYNKNKNIFFNEYMLYSKERISIYSPHILKMEKNIKSILLPEKEKKLNLLDFQYAYNHTNKEDIFFITLKRRIEDLNTKIEKNDNFLEDEKIKKKFGFYKNKNSENYYLYSIIDEEIIKNKLKLNDVEYLKNNLLMNETQNKNQRSDVIALYDKNMEFLKGLTFEELILFIILDRLENQYEILPKILFYENFMTILGDKIFFSNYPGYNEIDCIIYSKIDHKYGDDSPLIIQSYYDSEKKISDIQFEIKNNTLYFLELKSSSYYIKNDFFETTFNKCLEFTYLFEGKNMIKKDCKKEIMLIYDDKNDYSLSINYENKIMDFLKSNKDFSFNIVYSIKTYSYFSHSLALKKYDNIKKENEKLARIVFEQSKKIGTLSEDINKLKAELKNIPKQE